MNLNYKQRMLLLDILKEAKTKQSAHVSTVDNTFLDRDRMPITMPQDKEEYWLTEQSKAYSKLDEIRFLIETIKETI